MCVCVQREREFVANDSKRQSATRRDVCCVRQSYVYGKVTRCRRLVLLYARSAIGYLMC